MTFNNNSLQQLFFDFSTPKENNKNATNADIFVSTHNQKVFNFLFNYKEDWIASFALIIGQKQSGKSLLLNAFCNKKGNCFSLDINNLKNFDKNASYYVLDNLQNINKNNEESLFHLLNFIIANKKNLVMASDRTIDEIEFSTKDVKSRIRSSLVFYIEKADEKVMKFIFIKMCYNLGFDIPLNAVDYIFKNINTDFESLGNFAQKIYKNKMELNKKVTLPFVKDIIKPKTKFDLIRKHLENFY